MIRALLASIFATMLACGKIDADPDPYGITAALAERKRLRLAGWERRARR